MALENEQELIAAMEELRRQMNGLGTEAAAADNAVGKFGKTATSVGKEMAGAATQIMQGGGAFKSLGGVVDLTTKAIGGLLNIIPGVGGALKELAGAAGDAAKFVLQQFDDLSKNYQALGESSAIATDGIDGLQRQFRQMGLMTLPAFTRAINQNTIGFTALGGSVARGAEEFSNLAGAMTQGDIANGFLKLGMSLDGVGESSAKYIASFARYGLLQGRTFDQLQASTQKYLLEVDQIARLTGNTRKQQEDEQQKSLGNVMFRAKIEQMRANGEIEQAAELEKYVNGLTGPMADAARATLTGIPLTEEAAMANIAMGNAISENLIAIQNGAKATTALAKTQQAAADGTKQWAPLWQYTGDIAGGVAVQMMDQAAIVRRQNEIMEKEGVTAEEATRRAQEELIAQRGATQGFTNSQQAVAGSAKDLQNLSFTLVKNVIPAVDAFAGAIQKVTGFIDKRFGGTPSATPASMGGPGAGRMDYSKELYGKPEVKPGAPATKSQKEFMDSMYSTLLDEAKKQGVKNPEVIAKLGTAQSALETGYGKHLAGGQNYFGIKARPGEGGSGMATQEFINGKMVTVNDKFRKYGSMQESAADYIKFLNENKRYQGVLKAGTLEEAIAAQGRTGYATDPAYASKLTNIAGKISPVRDSKLADKPDVNKPDVTGKDSIISGLTRRFDSKLADKPDVNKPDVTGKDSIISGLTRRFDSKLADKPDVNKPDVTGKDSIISGLTRRFDSKLADTIGKIGPVSGYKATPPPTVDSTVNLNQPPSVVSESRSTNNDAQLSLLTRINETLDRLNQTAMTQVDVSTKLYRAGV
jgi:flagellum-specific peptidoglycan hydrolase FlgJ